MLTVKTTMLKILVSTECVRNLVLNSRLMLNSEHIKSKNKMMANTYFTVVFHVNSLIKGKPYFVTASGNNGVP